MQASQNIQNAYFKVQKWLACKKGSYDDSWSEHNVYNPAMLPLDNRIKTTAVTEGFYFLITSLSEYSAHKDAGCVYSLFPIMVLLKYLIYPSIFLDAVF